MAITTNDKNLGHATAYAYAKSKGYTGTEEEFAELMANYATVAESAEESRQAAEAAQGKAEDAQAAAETAQGVAVQAKDTAVGAKDTAVSAATTATTKAGEASASATSASESATAAAGSATSAGNSASAASGFAATATTKAGEASNSAVAAATAQEAAEDAQEAAEQAASSVSASAAQIATNTEDISDLKNALSSTAKQLANDKNIFKNGWHTASSTLTLSRTGVLESTDTANMVWLQIEPDKAYRISTGISSHKRVAMFGSIIAAGRNPNSYIIANGADDVVINSAQGDRFICIRLFTDADVGLSVTDFYPTLVVAEDTAKDGVLRENYPVKKIDLSNYTLEVGGISASNGNDLSSSYVCRTTGFIDANDLPSVFYFSGINTYYKNKKEIRTHCFCYEYALNTGGSGSFLRRKDIGQGGIFYRSPDTNYYRITCGWATNAGVAININDAASILELSAVQDASPVVMSLPQKVTWRVSNALARARQLTSIGYVPVGTIPNQSGDMVAGTYYHGVPYSSVRALGTYIGIDVSLHTFYTATQNPRSVLYTRKSTNSNSKTYYGTVCSALFDYLYGLSFAYNTDYMVASDEYVEKDIYNIEVGDVIVNDVHAIAITEVVQDEYDRVKTIGVVQAAPPRAYYTEYTPEDFKTFMDNNGYKLYEFVGLSDYGYEPCQYVKGYLDETVEMSVPDIMCEYGDKAVINAGIDVLVNVINSSGYSSINVYKNNTLVDTKGSVSDFTITNISYGTWKLELVGGNTTSVSEFIAVDTSACALNTETGVLTFGSANATPISVGVYGNSGGGTINKLTSSDVARGTFDLSGELSVDKPYAKVIFRTSWGQTTWWSYDLHLWANVT